MKQLFYTLIMLCVINSGNIFGERSHLPYINSIIISPVNPSTNDSIYLITNVTTSTIGKHLGSYVIENDSRIVIEAYYTSGVLQALDHFKNSISLGKKSAGKYRLIFNAYMTHDSNNFEKLDSNSIEIEFIVK